MMDNTPFAIDTKLNALVETVRNLPTLAYVDIGVGNLLKHIDEAIASIPIYTESDLREMIDARIRELVGPLIPDPRLSYAPPSNYMSYEVRNVVPTLLRQQVSLDSDKDYRVVFPEGPVGQVRVGRGRNVVIDKGGHIELPSFYAGTANESTWISALKLDWQTGHVHVEGMLYTNPTNSEVDFIHVTGSMAPTDAIPPNQRYVIQMCRGENICSNASNHGDLFQPDRSGPIDIDRFTGDTRFQGFFLGGGGVPIGRARLRRVNLLQHHNTAGERLIDFRVGTGATLPDALGPDGIEFDDVWLSTTTQGRRVDSLTDPAYTDPQVSFRPTVVTDGDKVYLHWPNLDPAWVRGKIYNGTPPGGDFVPRGSVGVGYISPGYRV